jgi:integrase
MIKNLPIKNVEDIERIKQKYREKELYIDLLMFLLVINTGLKMTTLFDMKVSQIKGKKYIQVAKGITYLLTDEIIELVSIVTKEKEMTDFVFTRRNKTKASRYYYYVNFKDIAAELALYNISVDSWRRTFGYHHYQQYKDLFFLQWYFNQNTAELAMDYIDVHEPMSAGFKQGLNF